MRLFFNWILLFVVFSGILCFPMFMIINIGVFKPDFQLPLYAITEIIEKEDKVYVGLGEYNRIQVYDIHGNYLNKIDVNTFGKHFNFYLDENNKIHSRRSYNQGFEDFKSEFVQFHDDHLYFFESQIPLQILKKTKTSNKQFLKEPLLFSLYASPFRSWFISFIGLVLIGCVNYTSLVKAVSLNMDKKLKTRFIIKTLFRKNKRNKYFK